MPPSSGELWGHHLMPHQINVDILLPTGVLLVLKCQRDATLESIKVNLWKEARKYPLFSKLLEPSSYIFVSITQDAIKEEFYDETIRLCDLRLFQAILLVQEPMGNREEKILDSKIGIVAGITVNEFNGLKDLEVITFRRNMLEACKESVEKRDNKSQNNQALYFYPPDVASSKELPFNLEEKMVNEMNKKIIITILVITQSGERQSYSLEVPHIALPEQIIAEAIRKRTISMDMSQETKKMCVTRYKNNYILKVCGVRQYLLGKFPISQYKYIRKCIMDGVRPKLVLLLKKNFYYNLPVNYFNMPSNVMKHGISALQKINNQQTTSLTKLEAMFRIKIDCATYINVRESAKIYVKAGIYHGTEPLCLIKDTEQVDASNPKWNEWLLYDLYVPDIPRSARLCFSICSISRKHKKVHYPLAWANINLFDFNNRLMSDKVSLHLWPMPQTLDELLNPIGIPESNTTSESSCLKIEFDTYELPISFPSDEEVLEYARKISHNLSGFCPMTDEEVVQEDLALLDEIIRRDPLSEILEQEKNFLWTMRHICKNRPNSISKLLSAVKWNNRESVAQTYLLLKEWPPIEANVALELLYCTYTDLNVRKFAVNCLKKKLTDDELSTYLLQLVQVLKFEPYLDNYLTRFLLHRSLLNKNIGHFFFWHLKSEMNAVPNIRIRYGLIIEAFCRGCGAHLESLILQVKGLEKLTKLTDSLKLEKDDDQMKVILLTLQQKDFMDALNDLPSPLNTSHKFGKLQPEQCKVMSSKKRPLWLVWQNFDAIRELESPNKDFQIIFKNGDDLRQDMLTLQVIRIMDDIWQSEGLDLRMIPYCVLATGKDVGMIEVVRNAKTVMGIQKKQDLRDAMQLRSKELHRWIKEKNRDDKYELAIDAFTKSCCGYCVATFILGIGDRHPDNIMVNEDGQVFHIDFGHFLDNRKKKFGVTRERVPFVLTEDFVRVIAKGADNPYRSPEFIAFMELCGKAYCCLRNHSSIFITLFTMMLSCGIPELQSLDDIEYLRKTLQVEKNEQESLKYFQSRFNEAYGGAWTTKLDWFFHWVKNRS